MSEVTDIILVFSTIGSDAGDAMLLEKANKCLPDNVGKLMFTSDDLKSGRCHQVNIAHGAFNHIYIDGFIEALRSTIDFSKFECLFMQVFIQDENCNGFGLVDIYRDKISDPAWVQE